MGHTWKDSINRQRDALTQILREPLEQITSDCIPLWEQHESLENLLLISLSRIPYCSVLYALDTRGRQITTCVTCKGAIDDTYGSDRSQRPYLKEVVPAWGFILSGAYISHLEQGPTITALQIVRSGKKVLGFICSDFDLRDLPVTSELYIESSNWSRYQLRHYTTDPVTDQHVKQDLTDDTLYTSLMLLEHLITKHGVFQSKILFSVNIAMIWRLNDPYNYQLLDGKMLTNHKTLDDYPTQQYSDDAEIPIASIPDIIKHICRLRQGKNHIYLRSASINLFNGKIGLEFSGNSLFFPYYTDFLFKNTGFWLSSAATEISRTTLEESLPRS